MFSRLLAKLGIFKVTEEDIRCGEKKDPHCCPLALAIGWIYPEEAISVQPSRIQIGEKSRHATYSAIHFINRFDAGEVVKPGYYKVW